MRLVRAAIVLSLVLTTVIAAPTAAQTAASSFTDLQRQLRADQTVYVKTAEVVDEHGRGIKGKMLELSGSSLRLLVNGQRREFLERDVLVVSERHTSAGKGILIGLAVGGGLGLWHLAASCGNTNDPEGCGWAQLELLVSVGGGALIGHAIGSSIERERPLFVAPDVRQSRTFSMTPLVGDCRKGLAATFRF